MTRSFLLVLVCALLAGCGGGDDGGGSDDGGGPSKEDFIAQANEICAEGEKKLQEFTPDEPVEQGASAEELRDTVANELEKAAEAYDPYLERLRELDPPDDLADGWTSFMEGIEDAFGKIGELADATRENDSAKLQELSQQFTEIAQDTRPFAEQNGLDDCLPDDSAP